MTYGIHDSGLSLPLSLSDRQTAQTFAAQQPTPAKAEQVRLNTLAVLTMQHYLDLMDIPSDLAASDSWNPIMQVCTDVADLELPTKGRLECRPVQPGAQVMPVPPETWEDRVGYVAVQIDEAAAEATILGFVPLVSDRETIPLSELAPPEALLDHLAQPLPQAIAHLSTWLQGAINTGWQTLEELFNPPQLAPAYAFRLRHPGNTVRQGRRIVLGHNQPDLALIVEIRPQPEQVEIILQLHPLEDRAQLPHGLNLAIIDDATATPILTATATGTEDFLELQLDGTFGEQFSVQIHYNDLRLTQTFLI